MHRHGGKVERALIQAIINAGGTATRTKQGHWKVTGPNGITTLGSSFDRGHLLKRELARLRQCGLEIEL